MPERRSGTGRGKGTAKGKGTHGVIEPVGKRSNFVYDAQSVVSSPSNTTDNGP